MIRIRYSLYALLVLMINGFTVQALADDYYTYGSTAFTGFAAESYGTYVFAVGSSGAGDDQVHAWNVAIPSGADANDRNYLNSGSPAPRTFSYLGSFDLGYSDKSGQASLYVSDGTLWYGSGQNVTLTDNGGSSTLGLRAYDWDVSGGGLTGSRDEKQDVIIDDDINDGEDESVQDSETLAYDESTDTWYIGTSDGRIFHLDKDNNWVEDFTHLNMGGEQGGIEIVDGLLVIADMSNDYLAIYENLGDVDNPDWQILDRDGDGIREGVAGIHDFNFDDVYSYNNSEAVNGLGHGQFDHLWATSGSYLYELGAEQAPMLMSQQRLLAVPEPPGVLLILGSLLTLGYFHRRRMLS